MSLKGIDAWVNKLGKTEMPVLANVIQELNELTGDDGTEVNHLAEVILKDANLTSQVLKIANSVIYNPSSYPINTVSKAIVLVGFTGVRAICISVMFIDSLLGKKPREQLLKQMANAFHIAVQARNLVSQTNNGIEEEVFIAGLLYHVGELAFWSSGGAAADELDDLLQQEQISFSEAAEQVLGCSFKSITKSLATSWSLGETLEQALYPPQKPSPKVRAVCLAEEINRAASCGWDSREMQEVIHKVTRFTGQSYLDAQKSVEAAAEEAGSVALIYGAPEVCHLIPSRRLEEKLEVTAKQPELLQANHELQLSVLRDLSNALNDKLDVNAIFQMVLEGLHKGIGLERVVLAFVQKGEVNAKFVLGEGAKDWRQKFSFPCVESDENIFGRAVNRGKPLWITPEFIKSHKSLYSNEFRKVVGTYPAFVSGIFLGTRCIALFYADRWNSGGSLKEDQFQSFCHFMAQTEMSLKMISEKRAR